jgi:hypothetical protein
MLAFGCTESESLIKRHKIKIILGFIFALNFSLLIGCSTSNHKNEFEVKTPEIAKNLQGDSSDIFKYIKLNSDPIANCYKTNLIRDPNLVGKIIFKLFILPDGSIEKTEVKSSELNDEITEKCMTMALNKWKFAPQQSLKKTIVELPYNFSKKSY